MTGKTAIEWSDMTWNPVTGCEQISPGCDHCYAMVLHNQRYKAYVKYNGVYPKNGKKMLLQYAKPFEKIQIFPDRLDDPMTIRTPQKIFVNSMSDWCHEDIPLVFVLDMFRTMCRANWHTYQLLTKRANRFGVLLPHLRQVFEDETGSYEWPAHIWNGVTIESYAQRGRARILKETEAPITFISYEPALGSLVGPDTSYLTGISQIIYGDESGKDNRPSKPEWAHEAYSLSRKYGMAFFLKQFVAPSGQKIHKPTLGGQEYLEFPLEEPRTASYEAFKQAWKERGQDPSVKKRWMDKIEFVVQ
jgi:protein gp37